MGIAENVYAALDLAHPIGLNAGFIVTEDGVVVVDSGWTHASAPTILGSIDAVAPRGSVRYLIWTEHHSDHIVGGNAFRNRGAESIAHQGIHDFLSGDGKEYVPQQRETRNEVWGDRAPAGCDFGVTFFRDVEFALPNRTIETETTLRVGREEIRLIPTSGPLEDSLCAYPPRTGVLFTGDTVYSGYAPATRFGGPGLWRLWVASLERLRELKTQTIIPEHGAPCGVAELDRNLAFLRRFLNERTAS
jgi:cyclase